MLYPYALTIAPASAPALCTKQHLDTIIVKLHKRCKKLLLELPTYELSKEHKYLHFHSLLYLPKNTYLKKLIKHPGYSLKIKPLNTPADTERWVSYLCKTIDHPIKQDQIFQESYYLQNQYQFNS